VRSTLVLVFPSFSRVCQSSHGLRTLSSSLLRPPSDRIAKGYTNLSHGAYSLIASLLTIRLFRVSYLRSPGLTSAPLGRTTQRMYFLKNMSRAGSATIVHILLSAPPRTPVK
jgi:hypothetical protein